MEVKVCHLSLPLLPLTKGLTVWFNGEKNAINVWFRDVYANEVGSGFSLSPRSSLTLARSLPGLQAAGWRHTASFPGTTLPAAWPEPAAAGEGE